MERRITVFNNSETEQPPETELDSGGEREHLNKLNKGGKVKQDDPLDNTQFMKTCDLLEQRITDQYKEHRNAIRNLKKLFKKEVRGAVKERRKLNSKFKEEVVPNKIAKFIKLDEGTVATRPKVTKLVYGEFRRRGLLSPNDKRLLRVDSEVQRMFKLSSAEADSINSCTNPKDISGLTFFNLQTYISRCYK